MDEVEKFNKILFSLKIKAECIDFNKINNYFYYDIKLYPCTTVKSIERFSEEISLLLKSYTKPNFKVLHEEGIIRLEFVNPRKNILKLFDFNIKLNNQLNCLLGQTIEGYNLWMNIEQNPHLLIAGTTGSGKSTLLHNIIANILINSNASLFLVDPKSIEFSYYSNIIRVYYTYNECVKMLDYIIDIMEDRYKLIRKEGFNLSLKPIIIIIDEFANLILQDKDNLFHDKLCLLAQKSRAARIYLIISTQRPSSTTVSGSIKANFPARIACKVASKIDSRIILDTNGAENLLGNGDALLKDNFRNLQRFQIAYITPQEILKKINRYL